jgi:hypothetical protein
MLLCLVKSSMVRLSAVSNPQALRENNLPSMFIQVGCDSCSHVALALVFLCVCYILSLLDYRHPSVHSRITSFRMLFLSLKKDPGRPQVCDHHCQELLGTMYPDNDFVLIREHHCPSSLPGYKVQEMNPGKLSPHSSSSFTPSNFLYSPSTPFTRRLLCSLCGHGIPKTFSVIYLLSTLSFQRLPLSWQHHPFYGPRSLPKEC